MVKRNKNTYISGLRELLIPAGDNDYRPWVARLPGVIVVLAALLLLHFFLNGSALLPGDLPDTTSYGNKVEELASEVNSERSDVGLNTLALDERLNQAAQNKAEHMITNNYWAHDSPEGVGAWSFINSEKYYYSISAENLARGFSTAKGVVNGWKSSQPHREAMLSEDYSDVGFGVAKGNLQGEDTTVYVALFAKPLSGAALNTPEVSRKILSIQEQSSRHFTHPEHVDFSLIKPLSLNSTLTLTGKITVVIFAGLISIYLLQHFRIIRNRTSWRPRIFENPIFWLAILVVLIAIIVATSFGSIV